MSEEKRIKQELKSSEPQPVEISLHSLPDYHGDSDLSRVNYFLKILSTHGVKILNSTEQPTGITAIYIDRPIRIPICFLNFLELKTVDPLQPRDCGSDEMVFVRTVSMFYTMVIVKEDKKDL